MNFFTDLIPQNTNWSKTHNFFYTFQRHKHCENNQNPKKRIQPNKNQTPTKTTTTTKLKIEKKIKIKRGKLTTRSRRRHGRAWEPAIEWSKEEGCEQLHPVQTSILSSSSFFFLLLNIYFIAFTASNYSQNFNQTNPPKNQKGRDTETEQEISKNREIYHMNMQNTKWVFLFHFCWVVIL